MDKVLAQQASTTTLTSMLTVPAATQVFIRTISVANISAAAVTFRLAIAVAGAATANKQYLHYDTTLAANSTLWITDANIHLQETDEFQIRGSDTNVVVNLFGSSGPKVLA